ncbi:MAG: aldose 1-epimerase family protein [Propionibacteriaceae bacterium]|nr:aldose 1-epimerase family protein [Propionibacteriaceae bacterium]
MAVTGTQFVLEHADYQAEVASVGASLRTLRYRSRDLIVGFEPDELRPAMRGTLLAPWPNRTADGRYEFAGRDRQLPLNEPELGNAAHGLVAWQDFVPVTVEADRLVLKTTIQAQPGYPWQVDLSVHFDLDEHGLRQEVVATNRSDSPAPFGVGGHPYVLAGRCQPHAIDGWSLELSAEQVMLVSTDRLLPVAIVDVADHASGLFDFRSARPIADTRLNNAFTAFERDASGIARVVVTDPGGTGVEVSFDERCAWAQIYSADEPRAVTDRHGIAIEPTTCPPDAFNSKRDLAVIAPGASSTAGWRIRALNISRPRTME